MQIFGLNSFGFNASRPEVKMIAFDSDLSNPFFCTYIFNQIRCCVIPFASNLFYTNERFRYVMSKLDRASLTLNVTQ